MYEDPQTVQDLMVVLTDGFPLVIRILIILLLVWGTLAVMLAGFGMMIGGPTWAAAVMRLTFAQPLGLLFLGIGRGLAQLPRALGAVVSAFDQALRQLVRLILRPGK